MEYTVEVLIPLVVLADIFVCNMPGYQRSNNDLWVIT